MEALKCIETRRSVRKFKDEALDHEVLEAVVKEASFAPSWKNSQVVRYVVVENQEIKSKIANDAVLGFTYNTGTIEKAAALVVVTMIHGRSGFEKDGSYTTSKEDRWEMFDAGIATQTFCLAAHEKGIGSVKTPQDSGIGNSISITVRIEFLYAYVNAYFAAVISLEDAGDEQWQTVLVAH